MAKIKRTVPKKFKVVVTQEDIDKGKVGNGSYCPIARACGRILNLKPSEQINVDISGGGYYSITLDGVTYFLSAPKKADDFIVKFDEKQPVKPFEFMFKVKYEEQYSF